MQQSVDWLRHQYGLRRNRNPRYSIRAFAKLLQVSPGRVSELLSGKRRLTFRQAQKIADVLCGDIKERAALMQAVDGDYRLRKSPQQKLKSKTDADYFELEGDAFSVIADWYHFALLNLITLKDAKNDPSWMAKRLGLSTPEVRLALTRLKRLSLIQEVNGKWERGKTHLTTTFDVPSAALRKSHRQSLEQAIEALESIPLGLRDVTSITFPMNVQKMAAAKSLIKKFERKIAALVHDSDATEVYNLNIQLIPLTIKQGEKNGS